MRGVRIARSDAGSIRGLVFGYLRSRLSRRRVRDGRGAVIGIVASVAMARVVIVPRRVLGRSCHVSFRCSR